MIIKNITKKTTIKRNAELCRSSFSKFVGLMFSANMDKALIFEFNDEKKIRLHMLFVFYPIDVLFLDKEKSVVDMKENFRPFSAYSSKRESMYAIELPKGIIKKTGTSLGDKIKF